MQRSKVEKQQHVMTHNHLSALRHVSRGKFDKTILSVYLAETWPDGVLVRRIYRSHDGGRPKC